VTTARERLRSQANLIREKKAEQQDQQPEEDNIDNYVYNDVNQDDDLNNERKISNEFLGLEELKTALEPSETQTDDVYRKDNIVFGTNTDEFNATTNVGGNNRDLDKTTQYRLQNRYIENNRDNSNKAIYLHNQLGKGDSTEELIQNSQQEILRNFIGPKANGSMAAWVDMFSSNHQPNKQNNTTTNKKSDYLKTKRKNNNHSFSNPKLIEQRAKILHDRRAEAEWHDRLRDVPSANNPRSRSPSPDRVYADVITNTINPHPYEWGAATKVFNSNKSNDHNNQLVYYYTYFILLYL
jgi:hypothetical protein